jgi:A/G-specific adenine glycosylase
MQKLCAGGVPCKSWAMPKVKVGGRKPKNECVDFNNAKIRTLVESLLNWFSENARDLPWRRTRDPYAIWVSEIMLQQTQVKTVIPYWERWMRELPTIKSIANESVEKIHKLWEGLGYYTRVRNLQKAAQQIVARHNGEFPATFDAILALPGIGRYTAGAICSIAFNQPAPILDGNVLRVFTRIFGIHDNPRQKTTSTRLWHLAERLVACAKDAEDIGPRPDLCLPPSAFGIRHSPPLRDTGSCSYLNQSLMELGALVCTSRSPNCAACPVQSLCVAHREHKQHELPNLGQRTAMTARRFIAIVAEHRGRFLVRQRPAGAVNAHLWEFPNVEVNGESDPARVFQDFFRAEPAILKKFCTIRHSITRYRITLEAHRVRFKFRPEAVPGNWRAQAELDSLAFTSAHKKILANLTITKQRQAPQRRQAERQSL